MNPEEQKKDDSFTSYHLTHCVLVDTQQGKKIGRKGDWILVDNDLSIYVLTDEQIHQLFTMEEINEKTATKRNGEG